MLSLFKAYRKRIKILLSDLAQVEQDFVHAPQPIRLGFFLVGSFARAALHPVRVVVSIPLHIAWSPQDSFTKLAERKDNGEFLDSYTQLIREQRHAVLVFIVMLVAVGIQLSVLGFGLVKSVIPTATEAVTSSKFIAFWDGAGAPPTGWTCISCISGDDFYQKFPRGNTTYGGTGGAATHTHAMSFVSSAGNSSGVTQTTRSSGSGFAGQFHEMTAITGTSVSSATSVPPYRDLKVIRYETPGNPSRIPSGTILMFDAAPTGSWSRYTVQDTNYLYGENDATTTGGTATHTHSFSGTAIGSDMAAGQTIGGSDAVASTHTHSFSGSTVADDHQPSRVDVLLYKATADVATPSGTVGLWNGTPPAGWTVASGASQTYNQRFLRGAAVYSSSGGSATHTPADVATTSGGPFGTQITKLTSPFVDVDGDLSHTHQITVGFDAGSNVPPYRDAIIAKKDAAASVTVSGRIFTDEGTNGLDCTTPRTVALRVNGAGTYSASCSNTPSNGSYSIASVSLSAGDIITAYVSGASEKAVTVTRASNATITNFDLYQNHLIVRHEDDGPISNTDLDQYDSGQDADIPFTVTTGALTVSSGSELHVWTGMTFTPGGSVTTTATGTQAGAAGDLHVQSTATLAMEANALSVGGDYTNSGTVSRSAGQTTTFTATGSGFTITQGTGSFENIVFNGISGIWTMQTATSVNADLTITNGTLTAPASSTLGVGGDFTNSGTFTHNSSTVTLSGATKNLTGSSATTFNNLTISGTVTVPAGGSDVYVAATLTVPDGSTTTIGTGRIVSLTRSTGTALTPGTTATITGTGWLDYHSSDVSFPSSGTVSSNVRFSTSFLGITIPDRNASTDYGGSVECSDWAGGPCTFGTSADAIVIAGDLLTSAYDNGVILRGSTNNPAVTVNGSVTFVNSGSGVTFNMGSGTWTVGGNFNLTNVVTFTNNSGTLVMNGTGVLTSAGNALNNVTSSGTVSIADATTISSALTISSGTLTAPSAATLGVGTTFTNNGTFTANSGTVQFNGTGNIAGSSTTSFYKLSANGTTTLTVDATVTNTLTTNVSKSFSINTTKTLTDSSTVEVVNSGSITGAGTLTFTSSTTGGPGSDAASPGTYSSIVRFDATAASIPAAVFDARTYSGTVELFSSSSSGARTVTPATDGTYILSGATSHLYLYANGTSNMTLAGATASAQFTIGGDIDLMGTGSGTESIQFGNDIWSVSGNINLTNGTSTVATNGTMVMTGSKNLYMNGTTFYNLTINGTGNTVVLQDTGTVSRALTVGANADGDSDTLTVTGTLLVTTTSSSVTMFDGTDTINGAGLLYMSSSSMTLNGVVDVDVYYDSLLTAVTIPGRAFGQDLSLDDASPTGGHPFNLGSAGGQTLSVGGNLTVNCSACESSGAPPSVSAANWDPNVTITGSFSIDPTWAPSVTLALGAGTWTIGGSANFNYSSLSYETNSTVVMNGSGTLTSAGRTLNNVEVSSSGTVILAAESHTVAGNLLLGGSGTPTVTGSTIDMTGTSKTIDGGSKTLNNLTISGSATLQNTPLTVGGTLNVANMKTLTLSANLTLSGNSGTTLNLNSTGSVAGAGTLIYRNSITTVTTSGTISSAFRFDLLYGNMFVPDRGTTDFGGAVEVYNGSGSTRTLTLGTAGSQTLTFASSLDLQSVSSGSTLTLAGNTYSPTMNITGSFTNSLATAATTVSMGSGTWTVSGNVNLTNVGTFNHNSGTLAMNGGSAALTSAGNTLNTLQITGGSPVIADAAILAGNLTISSGTVTAPSSTLTIAGNIANGGSFTANGGTVVFNGAGTSAVTGATTFNNVTSTTAGKTITFAAASGGVPVFTFSGTLTLTGTGVSRVVLSSGTPDSQWLPHFNAAQSSVTYTTIKDSGCDTGTASVTLDSSSLSGGNNGACWVFPTLTLTVNDGLGADVAYTTSATTLSGNWSISDATNVDHYEYAIGTTIGGTDVAAYTSTALVTNFTRSGLTLASGTTYYSTVRALNALSITIASTTSDGIMSDSVGPTAPAMVNDGTGADSTWTTSTTQLSANWTASSDPASGVAKYQYAIGTTSGGTDVVAYTDNALTLSVTRTGLTLGEAAVYYVSVRAVDNAGNDGSVTTSNGITVDTVAPTAPATVNDGTGADATYTTSTTQLSANWTASTDTTSGIQKYQYALGTTSGGTQVAPWTDNGTATSVTHAGLTLSDGTVYYVSVRAVDNAGTTGSATNSNGVTVNTALPSIADNQTGDATPHNAAGTAYNIDFEKSASGPNLDYAQYTVYAGAGKTGTMLKDWTDIFTVDTASYATNWPVDFTSLQEGTNYVSVRVFALDLLSNELDDAFTVLKDTVAPIVTSFASTTTTTTATLTWTTNEPSTTQVEYGTTTSYGVTTTLNATLTTSHTVTLTGIAANTEFHARALSVDEAGNAVASSDLLFTTLASPQTIITNVQVSVDSPTSVTVTWTTNEPATSKVRYGTTTAYGSEVSDATLVTAHRMSITGLLANTTYHYEVISTGSTTDNDADATFITAQAPVTGTVTTISDVRLIAGETIVTIQWTTNELATSLFHYGTTTDFDRHASDATMVTAHRIMVGGLTPGTTYHYRLISQGSTVTSTADLTFTMGTEASTVNRAIGPTVTDTVLHDGPTPTIELRGVAKGNQTIRAYLDGVVVRAFRTIGSSLDTVSFRAAVSTKGLTIGRHTLYLKSTDRVGRTSIVRQRITFMVVTRSDGKEAVKLKGAPTSYVVAKGDTLWSIAKAQLGDGKLYSTLIKANVRLYPTLATAPNAIQPGWVLVLPTK